MTRGQFGKTLGLGAAGVIGASLFGSGIGSAAPPGFGIPSGAIEVHPGEDIQAVIDAAPVDSIIYFNEGTYLLDDILWIRKGITLTGPEPDVIGPVDPVTGNPERKWKVILKGGGYWPKDRPAANPGDPTTWPIMPGEPYPNATLPWTTAIIIHCMDERELPFDNPYQNRPNPYDAFYSDGLNHAYENVKIENIFVDCREVLHPNQLNLWDFTSCAFGILDFGRYLPPFVYDFSTIWNPDKWLDGANFEMNNCKLASGNRYHINGHGASGEVSTIYKNCELTSGPEGGNSSYPTIGFSGLLGLMTKQKRISLLNSYVNSNGGGDGMFIDSVINPDCKVDIVYNDVRPTLGSWFYAGYVLNNFSANVIGNTVTVDHGFEHNNNNGILWYSTHESAGNIIDNTVILEQIPTYSGIALVNTSGMRIEKNKIIGAAPRGISLEGSSNNTVRNNDLSGFVSYGSNPDFAPYCFDGDGNPRTAPLSNPPMTEENGGIVDSLEGYGQNFFFSGNDHVRVQDSFALTNGLTMSVWILPTDFVPWAKIMSKGYEQSSDPWEYYSIFISGNDGGVGADLYINTGSGNAKVDIASTGALPSSDEPTHIALTYDGNWARLYMNGTQVGQQQLAGTIVPGGSDFCIGGVIRETVLDMFKGYIDEPAVWDRPLTTGEIAALADGSYHPNGTPINPNDPMHPTLFGDVHLLAYWDCDINSSIDPADPAPGTFQYLRDKAGNNDGIINYSFCSPQAEPYYLSGTPALVDAGSSNNHFGGNIYGPFPSTVPYCSDLQSCESSVKLNPEMPKAGIIVDGNGNKFNNENFKGYPGWIDLNGNWSISAEGYPSGSGAMLIRGFENQVNALKANGKAAAFNVCNQVIDANSDYDPPRVDPIGWYWGYVEGVTKVPFGDLSRVKYHPGYGIPYLDSADVTEVAYDWEWAYEFDKAGDPLLGSPLGNYVREDFKMLNLWFMDPIGMYGIVGAYYLAYWGSSTTSIRLVDTSQHLTLYGQTIPNPTDTPVYTQNALNVLPGYNKCGHAPSGYIEKLSQMTSKPMLTTLGGLSSSPDITGFGRFGKIKLPFEQ